MGLEAWDRIRSDLAPSGETKLQTARTRVSRRLLAAAGEEEQAWEVLVFASPIRNLTVVRDYTFHSFAVTMETDVDLPGQEGEITAIVERHCGPYRDEAARANARIERRAGVDILDPGSRVRVSTTDLGKARVTVSLFCPTHLAEALEDAITREVMALIHRARCEEPPPDATD